MRHNKHVVVQDLSFSRGKFSSRSIPIYLTVTISRLSSARKSEVKVSRVPDDWWPREKPFPSSLMTFGSCTTSHWPLDQQMPYFGDCVTSSAMQDKNVSVGEYACEKINWIFGPLTIQRIYAVLWNRDRSISIRIDRLGRDEVLFGLHIQFKSNKSFLCYFCAVIVERANKNGKLFH